MTGPQRARGEVRMVPDAEFTSYYGHPVLKKPVWKWEIPAYLYAGGLAGGSMMIAGAARLRGDATVARRATFTALAGVSVSPILLIADLGMPRRFYNMLRVVKVTSPMNAGTWILSAAGAFTGIAAGCEVLGILPRVRAAATLGAAAFGPPLATYTAALLADTAVPVWHEARTELPVIFGATSLATAGAASVLLNDPSVSAPARALCTGGSLVALAGVEAMERRLGEAGDPYDEGAAGRFGRAAKALTAAGGLTVALGGRRRAIAALGAAAVLAGGLCERWSIFRAGRPSATDPRYTVKPQRERLASGAGLRQAEEIGPPPDGTPAYVSAPPLSDVAPSGRA